LFFRLPAAAAALRRRRQQQQQRARQWVRHGYVLGKEKKIVRRYQTYSLHGHAP
jgi:hypothetical protein